MGKASSKSGTLEYTETSTLYTSSQHNSKASHSSDVKFKDIAQILKTEDKTAVAKEEKDIEILSEWYSHVYLTKKSNYQKSEIANIITEMIHFIPSKHFDQLKNGPPNNPQMKSCQVCYCDFDDESHLISMEKYCSHSMICQFCFMQHLKIKIKSDEIMPWILCPNPDCKAPVSIPLLLSHLTTHELYAFCKLFLRKHLMRNRNWIQCKTKQCRFGWVIKGKDVSKEYNLKCKACNTRHKVSKNPIANDDGFTELINSGVLKLCPKCALPTMKDKGMCNIMNCGKCGIHWNWRTTETGTSYAALKNKARGNGSLWEPGELAYQQNLQSNNLPEFVKLLERNGIKYDPKYVRGS